MERKTIRTLGSREVFDQEFGNVFLQAGESAVCEYRDWETDRKSVV